MEVKLKVVDSSCGIRNVFARMPFRFGAITMRAAPLLTLAVEIEDAAGHRATGYAADFLAYRWFDKRPHKSLADNCRDLLACVDEARDLYLEAGREGYDTPFALWRETSPEIERQALARDFNRLGASFGASMLERGVIDALGRMTGQPFAALVRRGLGIDLGSLCEELRGRKIGALLPEQPLARLHVRHTVGLIDPITAADRREAAVDDGLPETLEDYLDRDGIGYLKIKVSGRLDEDIARLEAIAALLERRDRAFHISLDGNEQYRQPDDNVPVVALQADLAAVALLGISHVERNGHHYFRGLGHLGEAEKAQALERHADLYERRGDEVFLRISDGMLACASLQVPGMGFAALPDMASLTPVDRWDFASLGVED
jgi:hypothetical protein